MSGGKADIQTLRIRAKTRLLHRSKQHLYSITSSARSRMAGDISRPSALAVFRLMTRLKRSRLLNRKIGWLGAAIDVVGSAAGHHLAVRPVRHQSAKIDIFAKHENRRHAMA
jgi:hypothetical protein